MLKLTFKKNISSNKIVFKQFNQANFPFVVFGIASLVGILLLATFLNVIETKQLPWLAVSGSVVLIAYVAKFGKGVYVYNFTTLGHALVTAFVIAGFAVIASSILYLVAIVVLGIASVIVFGSLVFIAVILVMLISSFVFVLPVLLYVGITVLVIMFVIKLFQTPLKQHNEDTQDIKLNIDKLKKSLKNKKDN